MEGYIGEIRLFAGNFAPRNWAVCAGQLLAIASNTALFSILGTTYGGDGRTTFALPDIRSRVPVGPGRGPGLSDYRIGEKKGSEDVTLLVSEIPTHTHLFQATNEPANQLTATNHIMGSEPAGATAFYVNENPSTEMSPLAIANTGGSQPHENRQPFLAMYYIICQFGIFPSRG